MPLGAWGFKSPLGHTIAATPPAETQIEHRSEPTCDTPLILQGAARPRSSPKALAAARCSVESTCEYVSNVMLMVW